MTDRPQKTAGRTISGVEVACTIQKSCYGWRNPLRMHQSETLQCVTRVWELSSAFMILEADSRHGEKKRNSGSQPQRVRAARLDVVKPHANGSNSSPQRFGTNRLRDRRNYYSSLSLVADQPNWIGGSFGSLTAARFFPPPCFNSALSLSPNVSPWTWRPHKRGGLQRMC